MRDLSDRTAFITGWASGIGFALGRAFAEAGLKVMLADVETGALDEAVKSLRDVTPDVRGIACDVADADSVARAAQATSPGRRPASQGQPGLRFGASRAASSANRVTKTVYRRLLASG